MKNVLYQVSAVSIAAALLAASAFGQAGEPLRVGGDAAYPPLEWLEDGRPKGFNVELARLLAEQGGREVEFRLGAWPDALAALESGEVDVVPMFISERRRERFRFSNVYHYQTHVLYGRPDAAPVGDPGDMDGLTLVVERHSFAADRLAELQFGARLVLTSDTLEALRQVAAGQGDYALLAGAAADALLRQHGLAVERKSAPFWPRGYAFAVRRDREALAKWVQAQLVEAMANGRFLALYDKWSDRLEAGSAYSVRYIRTVWISLAVIAAVLLLFVAWNAGLRRQVAVRSRALQTQLLARNRAERGVRKLESTDPLTGLANLGYFSKWCSERLEAPERPNKGELILVRLIDFESMIRSFGHSVAHRVMSGFGAAMRQTFTEPVAHFGRGVFAAFDPACRGEESLDALEQTVAGMNLPVHPRFAGASAFYPDDAGDSEALLQRAETALANGIQNHFRWVRYDASLDSESEDIGIIDAFQAGVPDGVLFRLQPVWRLSDDRVIGAELLVRWSRPGSGPVAPDHFIPLLESAGLIHALTDRALDEAAGLAAKVGRAGLDCRLGVNISARDLLDPRFIERVTAAFGRHGARTSMLNLELTETSLAEDHGQVGPMLIRLAELGVAISLDDFGTGYSSLAYLSAFPISEVKVDRVFVDRMTAEERDRSIVRSTILMAHELGLEVVAEGVEDDSQLELLKRYRCDMAQGYGLARPMDADALFELLSRAGRSAGTA